MKLARVVQATRSIFISYSHANVAERDTFLKFLRPLCERLGDKPIWVDSQDLQGGMAWRPEIRAALEHADVYIVLMSQDYCASPNCMGGELACILPRCRQGLARVIGVALHKLNLRDFSVRLADGQTLSLDDYQCLPQGMARIQGQERLGLLPINQWPDVRDAWHEVQAQLEAALTGSAAARPTPPPAVPTWRLPASARAAAFAEQGDQADTDTDEHTLNLPYLCDRQRQTEDLWYSLGDWHADACRRPLLIISEGNDLDCLQAWIERIARHEFANVVDPFARGELQFAQLQVFDWPAGARDGADATRRLTTNWARRLGCKPLTPLPEVQRLQAERMMPALWWCEVPAELGRDGIHPGLDALADLLGQWPAATPQNLLVVALNLVHVDAPDVDVSTAWLAEQLQPAVSRRDLNLAALGHLPEVTRTDLVTWAEEPLVKPHLPRGRELQRLRDQLVQPLRMRRFVEVYERWAGGG